jgi:hypothetical protein
VAREVHEEDICGSTFTRIDCSGLSVHSLTACVTTLTGQRLLIAVADFFFGTPFSFSTFLWFCASRRQTTVPSITRHQRRY